ncbi:MAG TPA: HlyD family efflux transporter periplasmic adaptor subunit [Candidatus Hydrogenedentes bacterium]|nr:HlyD family efflux transporter periplasmic adaptor subunit [Candidatus Hydrogenedentota bacterium]
MKREGFRRWFVKRFVTLCEVAGYGISAAVGIFIIYAVFARREILATANGTLAAPAIPVSYHEDALVVEFTAASGDELAPDAPLCRIVTDASAQRLMQAQRKLADVVDLLEQNEDPTSQAALANVQAALARCSADLETITLRAPATGILKIGPDAQKSEVIRAGAPLAMVYDLTRLELVGTLGNSTKADRVADGQPVRVRVPELDDVVHGRVEEVRREGDTASVVMRFEGVSQAARAHFATVLKTQPAPAVQNVEAKIVTGRRSLFRQIFGRR